MSNYTKSMMFNFKDIIEPLLSFYLPNCPSIHCNRITDAMTYSVKVGGKRIRPMLMYGSYLSTAYNKNKKFNEDKEAFTSNVIGVFMAAMEMIHTYSLIHDDLPAMDNDDLRRGKPTCHKAYDEASAILAGDALLNHAYEICINKACDLMEVDVNGAYSCMKATKLLATSAGLLGMIGGQGADIKFETVPMESKDELDFIHAHKTGAIIESALLIGGILGRGTAEELKALSKIGKNIGLAFQIQDDILDQLSSEEVLGKPIGSDLKNNKKTYISFVGLEQSIKDVEQLLTQSRNLLDEFEGNNTLLIEIIEFLKTREY